jgi:Protein of unknown function (DUF4230)
MGFLGWRAIGLGAAFLLVIILAQRVLVPTPPAARSQPRISDQLILERVQAVSKLVSSETFIRDVVTYQNTFYGSTKKSLVVVTGKVLAGVVIDSTVHVHVNDEAKTISLDIPHARVLDVVVTHMQTYDERSGLWNPFRPSDRDSIFNHVRGQLAHTADDMGVVGHADSSALALFQTLLTVPGYTVNVRFQMPVPVAQPAE